MRANGPVVFLSLTVVLLASCSRKDLEFTTPTATPAANSASQRTAGEPAPSGFGTITGTVTFAGKPPEMAELPRKSDPVCASKPMKSNEVVVNGNGTIKDVLVRIEPGTVKGKFEAPIAVAAVKQQDCMYVPRVQGVVAGQVIEVENGDRTMHNVHTYKGQETLLNQGQPAGSPPIKKDSLAAEPAVLKFKCDVHPWMTGYVIVTDHPFFQTTGTDGAFKLEKVPAGHYTLEAWHSKYGVKTAPVTVEPNKSVEVKFSFDGTEKGSSG